MAWTAPRTWVVGEVVTADMMNTHVRDNTRFLKGIDGTISLDAPIRGGTGSGTFFFEYEALVSASVVAIASATAGRMIYSSADRAMVLTDGTAHRIMPAVARSAATGQIVVGVGSGTFGLGTAPASADANRAWVTLGSASTGTWAAVNLGAQVAFTSGLGTFTTATNDFVQVTGYSSSLTFTGSRSFQITAQHNAIGGPTSGHLTEVRLLIDSTQVAYLLAPAPSGTIILPVHFTGMGTHGSGNHTFALQIRSVAGGTAGWGTVVSGTGATAGIFSIIAWS